MQLRVAKLFVFSVLSLCPYLSWAIGQDQAESMVIVQSWAERAQQQCYMKIHFDTFEYQDCIDHLASNEKGSPYKELGIYYFAYVGAMDSVRTGMYGANNTAWYFLKRFRRLQQNLRIDDVALCETVPGNCDIRIPQVIAMSKSRPPKPIDRNQPVLDTLHQH